MIGYCNPYRIPDKTEATVYVKNSYICYDPTTNTEMVRHDCFFKNYPNDLSSILHSELGKRQWEGKDALSTEMDPTFEDIDGFGVEAGQTSHEVDSWESRHKSPTFTSPLQGEDSKAVD
jgi:hypothetical protein